MDREINKQLIEKQAKEILDKFAKALESVEKESEEGSYIEREDFERKESPENYEKINDYKEKILSNAPHKDEDFIIAEKGGWK